MVDRFAVQIDGETMRFLGGCSSDDYVSLQHLAGAYSMMARRLAGLNKRQVKRNDLALP